MKKYVALSLMALFLGGGWHTTARAQEPAAPLAQRLQPAFTTLQGQIQTFISALSRLEEDWENGKRPLWEEAFRPDGQPYTRMFHEVFVAVRRNADWGNQELTMLDLMQWPRAMNNRFVNLVDMAQAQQAPTQVQWQDALLRLHQAYARSLIAAYGYMEMVKRAYLYANAPFMLRADERERRQELGARARAMHEAAQALMETFRAMRVAPGLAGLMPYHSSILNPIWEDRYAAGYFFRLPVTFANVWPLQPLFAPFPNAAAPPPAVMPPAEPPPANPPEGAAAGNWEWVDGQWVWRPRAVVPAGPMVPAPPGGVVPPTVQNNRSIREFILSLQARLEEDNVDPQLRRLIEGIIRQLGGPQRALPLENDTPPPMPRPMPSPGLRV